MILLEMQRFSAINVNVRRFKAMLSVLLALAWVPLTAHCQIESLAGLELFSCQSAGEGPTSSGSHCDDSSCCAWESAQYHPPRNLPLTLVPMFAVVLPVLLSAESDNLPTRVGVSLLTTGPPEMPRIWQITFRAALPVRAPSFVS